MQAKNSFSEIQEKIGKFEIIAKLGEGFNSTVYLGKDSNQEFYALKCPNVIENSTYKTKKNIKATRSEAAILKILNHQNIIHYFNTYQFKDLVTCTPYACYEYAENGDILQYITSAKGFPENISRYYFQCLIHALEFCHTKGYAHLDVKLDNILLDKLFDLKLADFGFSKLLAGKDGSGMLEKFQGTQGYTAPEIIKGLRYSGTSVDLFAAGVVLFSMLRGLPPFEDATKTDIWYSYFCNSNKKYWEKFSRGVEDKKLSPDFIDLINKLLAFQPQDRLNISDIKKHKWFNDKAATKQEVIEFMTKLKLSKKKIIEKQVEESKKEQKRGGNNTKEKFRKLGNCVELKFNDILLNDIKIEHLENFKEESQTINECNVLMLEALPKSITTTICPDDLLEIVLKHYAIRTQNHELKDIEFGDNKYIVKGLNYQGYENKEYEIMFNFKVCVSFEIMKIDENINAILFTACIGNKLLFYDILDEIESLIRLVENNKENEVQQLIKNIKIKIFN